MQRKVKVFFVKAADKIVPFASKGQAEKATDVLDAFGVAYEVKEEIRTIKVDVDMSNFDMAE